MSYMQPIVNLNGTSREELIAQRLAARSAIVELMTAMGQMSPHMRDYSEVADWQRDRAVYVQRFFVLDCLYNELGEEAVRLSEQG